MESPTLDTVYQAISALYDNPNNAEKEKASIWLGNVQKSIHSWKIADELLQHKKDLHSCYFAAQTMRSKVQHNLSELSVESVVSLRDSLVAHIEATTLDTDAPILTQLCLALADLALQMQTWQNYSLHEAASDCICAVLHCLEEIDNEDVEKLLFDSITSLENTYHMAVAHEEEEKAANYSRVFTELGETFLEKIIVCAANGNTHFAMRSLELVLVCVGHHDYEDKNALTHRKILRQKLEELLDQDRCQTLTELGKHYK
ncbi:Transportin-3 [Eumeta japonica]|uniref:Transportin-3 n=1 Tax=Eumeta variegata TaxID=151549 RepID=A0A4C1WND5_EUMVA|nr:Transportin-3 [Eumeta japonica]